MIRSQCHYLAPTLKEAPSDADTISHQLMIRAGIIRQLASGLYTFLPLGLKVLHKIETIIRQEMNKHGFQELLMPVLQPSDLWQTSGRWNSMGKEMLRLKNRHARDFVLGPTHEEVITDLVAKEIHSYKDLPIQFYQIQIKMRDEIRPRFGVIRSKEFIMKDAYSFHTNQSSLDQTYKYMEQVYYTIFRRCGLNVVSVEADSGNMGGHDCAEFIVLAESGEDNIVLCDSCHYASNLEKAIALPSHQSVSLINESMCEVDTLHISSIDDLVKTLKIDPSSIIKTLFYEVNHEIICILVRGSDRLNELKLKNYFQVNHVALADFHKVQHHLNKPIGFVGPVGMSNIRIVADWRVLQIKDAITGANIQDKHLMHVSYSRGDYTVHDVCDIVMVNNGDTCSLCKKGMLVIKQGIEVGHIFKLGQKYSSALKACYLDQHGKEQIMTMGCYGIGVSRTIAATIEQYYDDHGIIWPWSISPYHICIIPINVADKDSMILSRSLYCELSEKYDVILDDRSERAGIKFKDADLIGFPLRIVVSQKLLADNCVEIKVRKTNKIIKVKQDSVSQNIKQLMQVIQKEMVSHE